MIQSPFLGPFIGPSPKFHDPKWPPPSWSQASGVHRIELHRRPAISPGGTAKELAAGPVSKVIHGMAPKHGDQTWGSVGCMTVHS